MEGTESVDKMRHGLDWMRNDLNKIRRESQCPSPPSSFDDHYRAMIRQSAQVYRNLYEASRG